jgi:putative phage-type endonuclease
MMIQGSAEWHQARCGKVTASRIADVMARTKTGYGAGRANYMAELVAERLSGVPAEGFTNSAMAWGTEQEPEARRAYEFWRNAEVEETGFVPHPKIAMSGASPDGLVGSDGLVEIKSPNTATHLETLLGSPIDRKYLLQMQWQMACTGRAWCDFVSFDPRLPEVYKMYIYRVTADAALQSEIEAEVRKFLDELDAKVSELRKRFEPRNLLMAG